MKSNYTCILLLFYYLVEQLNESAWDLFGGVFVYSYIIIYEYVMHCQNFHSFILHSLD